MPQGSALFAAQIAVPVVALIAVQDTLRSKKNRTGIDLQQDIF